MESRAAGGESIVGEKEGRKARMEGCEGTNASWKRTFKKQTKGEREVGEKRGLQEAFDRRKKSYIQAVQLKEDKYRKEGESRDS